MRKATKELALCSMLAALSVVVLCLGGIVPFAVYACPMLASGALLLVREDGSLVLTSGLEENFSLAEGQEGREVTVVS